MDRNVTPDSDAPIIPNATTYQGDFLFPRKKVELSDLEPVILETINNNKK
jgi:hypothetical protein